MSLKILVNQNDEVIVEETGGGNPNYVETITGTLADPWGDNDIDEINTELALKNITLILTSAGSTMHGAPLGNGAVLFGTCVFDNPADATPYLGGSALYNGDDGLIYAKVLYGSSWTDLPTSIATTLTIIHHPLP